MNIYNYRYIFPMWTNFRQFVVVSFARLNYGNGIQDALCTRVTYTF